MKKTQNNSSDPRGRIPIYGFQQLKMLGGKTLVVKVQRLNALDVPIKKASSSTVAKTQDVIDKIPHTYPSSSSTEKVHLWLQNCLPSQKCIPSKELSQKNFERLKEVLFPSDEKNKPIPSPDFVIIRPSEYFASQQKERLRKKGEGLYLEKWFSENSIHPYPTEAQKMIFVEKTGMSLQEINDWFERHRSNLKYSSDEKVNLIIKGHAYLREWLSSHLTRPHPTVNQKIVMKRETGYKLPKIDAWFRHANRKIHKAVEMIEDRDPEKLSPPQRELSSANHRSEDELQVSGSGALLSTDKDQQSSQESTVIGDRNAQTDKKSGERRTPQQDSSDVPKMHEENPEPNQKQCPSDRKSLVDEHQVLLPGEQQTGDPNKSKSVREMGVSHQPSPRGYLKAWVSENHTCPTKEQRMILVKETGWTYKQISNWFVHYRMKNKMSTKQLEIWLADRSNQSPGIGVLKEWLAEKMSKHCPLPPSQEEQRELAEQSGLTLKQICNWFNTARSAH